MTTELVESLFLPRLGTEQLRAGEDSGMAGDRALTIDSFTVTPQDFPGGDIGRLAVCGTVNDLAMVGARPLGLAASFVLEEGLEGEDLARWADSMGRTCREAGTELVAADTKVVERGAADRAFVTTAGVGLVPGGVRISASLAEPGDAVLVSGPVGDHGATILSLREGLGLDADLRSDATPLVRPVFALIEACEVHTLRDPTRGGLAQTLNEIASASGCRIELEEGSVPVRPGVRAVCDLVGIDPLEMACEGRFLAVLPATQAEAAIRAVIDMPSCAGAAVIGRVREGPGDVVLRTRAGARRLLAMPLGEHLPRIC
jgi:hydrogenase expression/formation protein HypE